VMELYRLHMLAHPPELPNRPATYTLMIAREASLSGSVQSANCPSWDSLARKLASVKVGEGELQKAKRELDASRYYRITGVSLELQECPCHLPKSKYSASSGNQLRRRADRAALRKSPVSESV
jgi:hypothetical protein